MLRLRSLCKVATAVAGRRFTSAVKPIECLAAVAWQPEPDFASKAPLRLATVIVAPPAETEVRLRIHYATLCGPGLAALAARRAAGVRDARAVREPRGGVRVLQLDVLGPPA